MAVYKAPLKEIQFVMNEVLDVSSLAKLPGYEDATPDTIQAVLEEAAKLCENVLFPLNRTGDEEGCHYENGVVRTPKGFKEAYNQFREGGWTATTNDPKYGGQGLPATVGFAVTEIITASNQAFGMYPGLTHGAYNALKKAGKVTVPFAVPQGANGDAYHMYPLFSGLGGYIFGTTASGSLNVKDVGLDNPTFRKNQGLIDQWNKTGLINSKVDYGIAKTAFTTGKSPFWITGPWELDAIKALPFKYRVTAVPTIVSSLQPVPFLGAQGAMVTKYAAQHGVQVGANALVTQFMASAPYQAKLAAADGRTPANLAAAKAVTDPVLFDGEIFNGVETRAYSVPAIKAGNYLFICKVHPTMIGTLTVK